jgi:hypothetical protein
MQCCHIVSVPNSWTRIYFVSTVSACYWYPAYGVVNLLEPPVRKRGLQSKGKGKVLLRTGHEGPQREYSYSSTLSLTSALDGVEWLTPRPGSFTAWKKTRYPFYRRLGGPQGRSGRKRKISPPPRFDPRTVQPVASRYTDWAISAHLKVAMWSLYARNIAHKSKAQSQETT